jgi:hypothetical protein
VTKRPSPSGRGERSSRTQKDDETVEGTPVFRNAFAFAGGCGKEDLGQHDKPSITWFSKGTRSRKGTALKRCGGVRRGGRDSNSFAATGW